MAEPSHASSAANTQRLRALMDVHTTVMNRACDLLEEDPSPTSLVVSNSLRASCNDLRQEIEAMTT